MLVKDVKKLSVEERLWYWIRERELIRGRKEAGEERPWTDDWILDTYRFCNVRRMDDRVSKWLLNEWYLPHYGHKNALVACALARFFNRPSTLERIGFPRRWSVERAHYFLDVLHDVARRKESVFNGAYIVMGSGGGDKIEKVLLKYVQSVVGLRLPTDSMQAAWTVLMREGSGYGSFMAGQVVADLRYAMDGDWGDRYRWAPYGPGSKRGMNRLLGRPLYAPMKQSEFCDKLVHRVIEVGERVLPASVTGGLEAIDWQNCLCEFDKYSRALEGTGAPKRKYKEHSDD